MTTDIIFFTCYIHDHWRDKKYNSNNIFAVIQQIICKVIFLSLFWNYEQILLQSSCNIIAVSVCEADISWKFMNY